MDPDSTCKATSPQQPALPLVDLGQQRAAPCGTGSLKPKAKQTKSHPRPSRPERRTVSGCSDNHASLAKSRKGTKEIQGQTKHHPFKGRERWLRLNFIYLFKSNALACELHKNFLPPLTNTLMGENFYSIGFVIKHPEPQA